jgi:ribonuclease HII
VIRRDAPFLYDRARLADLGGSGRVVAGADEAGRGCLAGPLVSAAVSLDYDRLPVRALVGLTDSKLLRAEVRERLYAELLVVAARITVAVVSSENIDEFGIQACNLRALASCLEALSGGYSLALVDGFDLHRPDLRACAVVRGDRRSAAVAAASIVAKVTRDRLMHRLHADHPQYGFLEHVGYGTPEHRAALREHGICVLHRRSFAGVGSTQLELREEQRPSG